MRSHYLPTTSRSSLGEFPWVVCHGSLSLSLSLSLSVCLSIGQNPSTRSWLTLAQEPGSWGVDDPLSEDVPLRSSTSLFHPGKQYLRDAHHILPWTGSHHGGWTFQNSLRHSSGLPTGQPWALMALTWSQSPKTNFSFQSGLATIPIGQWLKMATWWHTQP
jgi:hypothetical protein